MEAMPKDTSNIEPIGIIHTQFRVIENMPIQPTGAGDVTGTVELLPELADGLRDLDGFSHVILLYYFHEAKRTNLLVTPFLDRRERGVFATRAPVRPNHIGMSVVELVAVEDNVLTVRGIDVLDGTPLLDVKPYVEKFDHRPDSRSGWMKASLDEIDRRRSDGRFG
jgi:tRNA-Thr(GGU) m(6)t(6)A37 methyltransferase TsaA